MTKPADSDQIAKARRIWSEWCGTNGIEAAEGWLELTPEQARKFAIAFAASERQAVIEECAKVAEDPANREPGWSLSTQRMIAAAIRSRVRRGKS